MPRFNRNLISYICTLLSVKSNYLLRQRPHSDGNASHSLMVTM